jgi:hypothetical protein
MLLLPTTFAHLNQQKRLVTRLPILQLLHVLGTDAPDAAAA